MPSRHCRVALRVLGPIRICIASRPCCHF
jgi:hypothetical protein